MAKAPVMNADFARWYAEAFMDEGATRELRWKGILEVAAKADHQTLEVLTRLAFQTPVPAAGRKGEDLSDTHEFVMSTISGSDAEFVPAQSTRELQILAAATLFQLFTSEPDAGLMVTTAAFCGARQPDLPMDLAALAEREMVNLSARQHARTPVDELKLLAPKVSFAVAPEALQSMDATIWAAQFARLHLASNAAFEQVVKAQNRVVTLLNRQISLGDEELQMLWWLLSGRSHRLDMPFSKIEMALRPLVLAQELGNMTEVSPGPVSIRAMLLKAGVGTEDLGLQDAVNACDIEWARSASESKLVSPVTTPIHFALEQRAEVGSNDSWQPRWSSLTGLAADISLPAVQLGELFYREHIYMHVSA